MQNRSEEGLVRCINLRLTVGMAPIARRRRRFTGSQETSRAIAVPLADHLLKWSFTIPAEKGRAGKDVFGRMFSLREVVLRQRNRWKKVKAVTSVML